ncbi:MAG: ComEC/Rec2 family competence protein [Phycisphaeraceae bacterium]|nr:ComEC/Rec2 family competence protein [Phycisphaeraceae bacterium]
MPARPKHNHVHAARTRAAYSLLFLALGLLASWQLPEAGFSIPLGPLTLFLVSAALAAIALLNPGRSGTEGRTWARLCSACLCCSIFLFALGWGHIKLREPVAPELTALIAQSSDQPIFRLTILDSPRTHPERASWTCLARVRAFVDDAGSTPINANIWLSARSSTPPRPGDRLIARGTFRPLEPPRNPGEFELQRWGTDRNIAGSFLVSSAALLRPDESRAALLESGANACRRALGALRARASDTVDALASHASPDARQLLRGLLLGENPPSPTEGLASFYQLGLAHILSISGFHLMVFAAASLFTLRLLGDLGRLEPILVGAVILLFLAIVPASSPLVRAATILLVLLGAECFGRRYDRLTLLLWTAVAVLLFRPSELWSLGFQLSFGLTAALLALAQRLSLRLFPPPLGVRPVGHWLWTPIRRATLALVVTGLLCWTLSAPWIASHVGIFNPLSIITGILITPVIVLALWVGYAALLLGLAVPPVADGAAPLASAIAELAVASARWWDSLPIAVIRVPPVSSLWALCATSLLAFWFVRARICRPLLLVLAMLLLAWGATEALLMGRLPPGLSARVYLLDEAPGRCTIIQSPAGADMLDAGSSSPKSQGRDLAQVARHLGAWRLHTLVLDPSDPNSISGAPEVIRTLRPANVVFACEGGSPTSESMGLIDLATRYGARVHVVSGTEEARRFLPDGLRETLPERSGSGRGMQIVDVPR